MVQCIRYLIALALFVGPGIAAVIPPQEFATRDVHGNDLEARKINFGKFIHSVGNVGKKKLHGAGKVPNSTIGQVVTMSLRRDEDGVYERDIEDDLATRGYEDDLFARDLDDDLTTRDYEDGLFARDHDDILFSRDYEDGLYERDVEDGELERRGFSFKKIGNSVKNAVKAVGRGAGAALRSPVGQAVINALPRDLEDDLYERDVLEDEFYAREVVDDIYDLK